MDNNNESKDLMDELTLPDNISLPDADKIKNSNFDSVKGNLNGTYQSGTAPDINGIRSGYNSSFRNNNYNSFIYNKNVNNGNASNGFAPGGNPANGYAQNGNASNGYVPGTNPANGYTQGTNPANGYTQGTNPANGYAQNGNPANRYTPGGNIQRPAGNMPQQYGSRIVPGQLNTPVPQFPAGQRYVQNRPPARNVPNQKINRRVKINKPLTKSDMIKQEVKKIYNRTGVCLLIHDVLIFGVQIFLVIVLAFSTVALRDFKSYLADENANTGIAAASVFSCIAGNIICAVLGLSLTKRLKEFPKLYSPPKISLLPALLAFPAIFGFQGIIAFLHKGYFIIMNLDISSEVSADDMNSGVFVIYFIYAVILGPITEEILFRGMVLKNLSVVDEKFAIFFSSFLFGLFHENVLQMITATLLGILLAYTAIKTDSIILPTLLHIFNNLYAEISGIIPDSKIKTIVIFSLYAIGIVAAVLFFILTRKKETPQNNYRALFDTTPSEERSLKLSAALSAPAVIVYLVLIMVMLSFEMLATFVLSWFT